MPRFAPVLDLPELTFIVLHLPEDVKNSVDFASNDANAEGFLSRCPMAGDVNVFLSPMDDEEEEDDDPSKAPKIASPESKAPLKGEMEIMIAGT